MTTTASPTPVEDEAATTRDLAAAADNLERDLDHDPAGPDTELGQAEADRASLFDDGDYIDPRLVLDTPDGSRIGAIKLKITGTIVLDRNNPTDVALYKRIRQGGRFDFEVETVATNEQHTVKVDADGYPTGTTTGTKTLTVTGLTELEIPDQYRAPKAKTATVDETFGEPSPAPDLPEPAAKFA